MNALISPPPEQQALAKTHTSVNKKCVRLSLLPFRALTHDVEEGEELAEEVSVGPEVVVLQVGVEVVDEELLLLPLLHLGDDPQVEVHHEGGDLARLPVFPQPPRDVKEDRLKRDRERYKDEIAVCLCSDLCWTRLLLVPSLQLPSPSWVTVGDLSNVAHIPSLPGPFFSIRPGRELEDGREMSQGMRESEREAPSRPRNPMINAKVSTLYDPRRPRRRLRRAV